MNTLDLLKLHYKRKVKLSKQYGVSKRKIQDDTDNLIDFLKDIQTSTGIFPLSREDFLSFVETHTESFYYALLDWDETEEYRLNQIQFIISNIAVLVSSQNEMVLITPI